jgi:hypothetical protein
MKFVWMATTLQEANSPRKEVILTHSDFIAINSNTLTCPVFRTSIDAELTKKIYQRVPVLENEQTGKNP